MPEIVIDRPDCWRCPVCGIEWAIGAEFLNSPPKCSSMHPATEMEQVTVEGFVATHRQMKEDAGGGGRRR
jgi:hypothetical protein